MDYTGKLVRVKHNILRKEDLSYYDGQYFVISHVGEVIQCLPTICDIWEFYSSSGKNFMIGKGSGEVTVRVVPTTDTKKLSAIFFSVIKQCDRVIDGKEKGRWVEDVYLKAKFRAEEALLILEGDCDCDADARKVVVKNLDNLKITVHVEKI